MDTIIKKGSSLLVPEKITIPYIGGDCSRKGIMLNFHKIIDSAVQVAYSGRRSIIWNEIVCEDTNFSPEIITLFKNSLIGMRSPLFDSCRGNIIYPGLNLVEKLDLHTCFQPIHYLKGLKTSLKNPEKVNLFLFTGGSEFAHDNVEWEYGRTIKSALRFAIKKNMPTITIVHSENVMNSMERAFKVWGYEIADKEYANYTFSMDIYKSLLNIWGKMIADEELEKAKKNGKIIIRDESIETFLNGISDNPEDYSVVVALSCCGDYISDELTEMVGGAGILPKAYYNYDNGYVIFESEYITSYEANRYGLVNFIPDLLSGMMLLEYIGWNEAGQLIKDALQKDYIYRKPSRNKLSLREELLVSKVRNMLPVRDRVFQ